MAGQGLGVDGDPGPRRASEDVLVVQVGMQQDARMVGEELGGQTRSALAHPAGDRRLLTHPLQMDL